MQEPDIIQVVIADDHELLRTGMRGLLTGVSNIEVTGEAADGAELLQLAESHRPHVVITDIAMPRLDGLEATRQLLRKDPFLGVITLTMYAETQYIADAIEAGARGFLLKNTNREELVRAITLVREGHTYYTPKMSDKIVALAARTHFYPLIPADKPSFSKMELQVMQLICKQQSSKEIAHQLRISQRTVEGTRERLQKKTGSQNMIGIALYAIKNGIFTLD